MKIENPMTSMSSCKTVHEFKSVLKQTDEKVEKTSLNAFGALIEIANGVSQNEDHQKKIAHLKEAIHNNTYVINNESLFEQLMAEDLFGVEGL